MPKIYDQIIDQVQPDPLRPTEGMYFHTKEVAVLYPLYQSIVTGILVGVAVTVTFLFFGWPRSFEVGVLSFALIQLLVWIWSVLRWNSWVHKLESLIGMDLNRNGVIGWGSREPVEIRIIEDGGRLGTIARLPATDDQLIVLSSALVKGAPFAIEDWSGRGRPFSKDELYELRNEMFKRNLLEWENPNSHARGVRLTKTGWAVVRHYASQGGYTPPSPTPDEQS